MHLLMISYGWTMEEALEITMPQAQMLFREMGKVPAPAMALAALMESMNDKNDGRNSGDAGTAPLPPVTAEAAKFLLKLGVAPGDERG